MLNRLRYTRRFFSSGINDFVTTHLRGSGFTDDMIQEEVEKLQNAKILNTDVLSKLGPEDWASTGISTGASVILRDALDDLHEKSAQEKIKKTSKLQRTLVGFF